MLFGGCVKTPNGVISGCPNSSETALFSTGKGEPFCELTFGWLCAVLLCAHAWGPL